MYVIILFIRLYWFDDPLLLWLGEADLVPVCSPELATACCLPAWAFWSRAASCVRANIPLKEKCSRLGQYFNIREWFSSGQNWVSLSMSFSSFVFVTTSSTATWGGEPGTSHFLFLICRALKVEWEHLWMRAQPLHSCLLVIWWRIDFRFSCSTSRVLSTTRHD